jgi:hypothetical protein
MAEAQPTPVSTWIAATGQFFWQAPHSMQAWAREIFAWASASLKTACGHTSMQRPQPMQSSADNSNVDVPNPLMTAPPEKI